MEKFLSTFSRYITPDDIIVLAVSGGVDSMVLFDLVKKHHPREKIIVAHFDHCLRWAESDWDRELVASICKSENIAFEVEKMDIGAIAKDEKNSLEAVARERRYEFLRSVRDMYHARSILTAHHMDDQAETILMWLMKWGKIRGLSGMSLLSRLPWEHEDHATLLRPLLDMRKSDILEYARVHHVAYRDDATNLDTTYQRNKIRHTLMPILRDIEPSADRMLADLGEYMQELAEFIEVRVDVWLKAQALVTGEDGSFLMGDFLDESVFFQREIISTLYARAHDGSTQGLSRWAIEECLRFMREASNSHGIKEIKNLHLKRRGEKVYY